MTCEARTVDRYGRTVGLCRANGADIGAAMVQVGMAWAFVRYSGDYVKEEARARRGQLTRRYGQFCRRYRPEAKEQRRSRWGGWRLWREIEGGEATGQGDLFGASGASYRGGGRGRKRVGPVAVLRPGVLAAVERFIVTNQPSGGRHGDWG